MSHQLSRSAADADVIVVGAGPGGSAAAARLALLGRRVTLLEAAAFPRDKVCGDVLLPELDSLLAAIGLDLRRLAPEAREIKGCVYTAPGGRRIAGEMCDARGEIHPWRALPRLLFDQRLALHAQRCGAELREEQRVMDVEWRPEPGCNSVRVRTRDGVIRLRAPLVIGADGAASRVAHSRGLRPNAADRRANRCVTLRTYVPWVDAQPYFEVITDRALVAGCGWIVPGPYGKANVGVGVIGYDRATRVAPLRAELERLLGGRVDLASAPAPAGWQIPFGDLRRRATADGLLLVGDAAGFADPFTGHGIHTAVHSGLLAAEAADAALASGDLRAAAPPLAGYERAWRRRLGGDFFIGQWLQRLMQRAHATPWLLDLIVGRAAHSRRWADRFMGLIGHAIPKTHVLRPGFTLDFIRSDADWRPPRELIS
jgi:geranylgeranyl reductase family protein